jgi:hypothetical protein
VLCGAPKLKVLVISPDLKRIVKSSQELTPILESFCDCEHLTLSDLVIALGFFKERGLESNQMPKEVQVVTFLQDHPFCSVF